MSKPASSLAGLPTIPTSPGGFVPNTKIVCLLLAFPKSSTCPIQRAVFWLICSSLHTPIYLCLFGVSQPPSPGLLQLKSQELPSLCLWILPEPFILGGNEWEYTRLSLNGVETKEMTKVQVISTDISKYPSVHEFWPIMKLRIIRAWLRGTQCVTILSHCTISMATF